MKKFALILIVTIISCQQIKIPEINEGEFIIEHKDEKIHPGTNLNIFYKPKSNENIDCFEINFMTKYDNSIQKYIRPEAIDNILNFQIQIPDYANHVTIYAFGNTTCWTGGVSYKSVSIYNKDSQLKPRSLEQELTILYWQGQGIKADSLLKTYLDLYPNELMLYRSKIEYLNRTNSTDEIKKIYSKYLNNTNPEAISLRLYINIILGNKLQVLQDIEQSLNNNPDKSFLPTLLRKFQYAYYGDSTISNQILNYRKNLSLNFPLSDLSKEYIDHILIQHKNKLLNDNHHLVLIEDLIDKRIKAQNYDSYYQKANYEFIVKNNIKLASDFANKYIKYKDNNSFVSHYRSEDTYYLTQMYKLQAEILHKLKEYEKAIPNINRAIEINSDKNILKELYLQNAQNYKMCNNKSDFKKHIVKSISLGGYNNVKDYLASIYDANSADSLSILLFQESANECQMINSTKFETSENTYYSGDGNIFFINFWSPGCKPCIEEIPILNSIKEKYSQYNIKWLANKYDEKMISKLSNKFNNWEYYGVDKTHNTYITQSVIPQTFIIDGKGRLRYHKIGGIKEADEITPLLDLLIK